MSPEPSKARAKASLVKTAALTVAVIGAATASAFAQNLETQEVQPAPAAIGADVPATYFGPQPSQVQRELVGEYQNLKSGKIDFDKGTITLPLYQGAMKSGETVWYVVTDTDDKGNAEQLGLNYSPKLTFADVGRAVRNATLDSKFKLIFDVGTVDFSPKRSVTPGDAPNFFPPSSFSQAALATRITPRLSRSPTLADTSTTRRWSPITCQRMSSTNSVTETLTMVSSIRRW